ncbi:hypothetical protein RB620_24150 [Paenibacillus sp. LHD-117]|uniref:hypothetical protein n=1 Tax=Paenibacillus sp. LHD-117 TaxID=3071412 RepID=UPI0027DF4887|nr:hypothetical protein [Paenibacillus sp. LHD-117]MDQ6422527.1 hypothetical protein [Paenibacillus sp. LHD-117]
MNPNQNPGAGNGHGIGQGSGQGNVIGSEHGFAHRHGQSLLNRPYSGLHGSFQYDDAPLQQQQQQLTYPPHIVQREGNPSLLPAVLPQAQNQLIGAPPKPSGGGFSLANLTKYANLTEIKGLVDRMGGLDGILSTVTKVQKVVSGVSQMAPLMKVFMGSFGKKSSSSEGGNEGSGISRPKARKRRPSSGRRPRSGASVKRRSRPRRRR